MNVTIFLTFFKTKDSAKGKGKAKISTDKKKLKKQEI
jgi:hypothetical protein